MSSSRAILSDAAGSMMAGFDWAKPANVYVASVAVLWVLFAGVIAALYVALRLATGAATSGATPAALLATDGVIAATSSGPWPGSLLAEAAGR